MEGKIATVVEFTNHEPLLNECTDLIHAEQGVELHRPRDVRRAEGAVVADSRFKNAFQRLNRRRQLRYGRHYSLQVAGVIQQRLSLYGCDRTRGLDYHTAVVVLLLLLLILFFSLQPGKSSKVNALRFFLFFSPSIPASDKQKPLLYSEVSTYSSLGMNYQTAHVYDKPSQRVLSYL